MGIVKKVFIFFSLCNILIFAVETEETNENNILKNSEEISEQVEEEVLTGRSLFYENSKLIRIEVRENNVGKFETEKSKNQDQNQEPRNKRENTDSTGEIATPENNQESEENKS